MKFALSRQANDAPNAQRTELQQKLAALSPHERQVLDALVDGRPHKSISRDLGLSAHTVEIHRASVMTKMQATSLSLLVRMMLLTAPLND